VSSDFKELNLVRTRLEESIRKFWEANNCQNCKYISDKPSPHRAEYIQDGDKVIVDFYLLKNGTTTITTTVGKNHEKGQQLALYLKDELVSDDRKSISVGIKNIEKDNFDLLIEFIQELKDDNTGRVTTSISVILENSTKKVVRVTSQHNDSLTLTHYLTTSRLQIQGKPLYIYDQVCYLLSEITDLNGFLAIVHKGEEITNTINVNADNIENTLKTLFPKAYSYLGDGILRMIRTSYVLKDLPIPLEDYSCYVFPSLRALEGVMRKLLFEKGCSIEENNNSFYGVFNYDRNKQACLVSNEFRQQINDSKTCAALECCYVYFKQQRNELFHANDFTDSSRIIPTQQQASQIIEKVVKIIEEAYSKLLS
jgi:RNase LS, bacterial toxin DBD domain/RNase LS, bacterial toxin N-terminal/RNase LS, bacterial toxin